MSPNPHDATSLLIQRISTNVSPAGATQSFNASLFSQFNTFVANAASYAQILSTAGPIATLAADQIVVSTGATVAGAAAESTTLAAAAGTGYGAVIVLAVAVVLAIIASSSDSGSSETQQLNQLNQEIIGVQNTTLMDYWLNKWGLINVFWTGALGSDLDNLAAQGTGGNYVHRDAGNFHGHAQAYVNNLVPAKNPGADVYFWERPVVPDQLFLSQAVTYPAEPLSVGGGGPIEPVPGGSPVNSFGEIVGWYGLPPQGPTQNPTEQTSLDPHSMLPFLLLGIQSYLAIQALVHYIDGSQPTFTEFLKEYQGDLQEYANFLSSQYTLAVNGIVKSDLPNMNDVLSFLYFISVSVQGGSFPDDTRQWGGSKPAYMGAWVGAGDAWNGVCGAVDKYPTYGAYEPAPPVPVPYAAPAYIIDMLNTDNAGAELQGLYATLTAAPPGPEGSPSPFDQFVSWLRWWTIPWVTAKVILGTMARWKAIYLFNGYDKVWSTLQNLQSLSGLPPLPTPTLTQDGTIANGNWSARELIKFISSINSLTYPIPDTDPAVAQTNTSLLFLVQALDGIVNGTWAGPPSFASTGGVPPRPLGFRDRLAAAAV